MRSVDLKKAHAGTWGFGKEGQAALAYLASRAQTITVVDEGAVISPAGGAVNVRYAGADLAALLTCDVVFVSPGVSKSHEFIRVLSAASIELVSGTGWWMEENFARTIGVTGTKGKSTTADLVNHLLHQVGIDSVLAGNIGEPLLNVPAGKVPLVAELSSYQCAWLTRSPRVAVITNLFEEHIPWHGSVVRYWLDKAKIFSLGAEHLVCDQATLTKLHESGVVIDADLEVHVVDSDGQTLRTAHGLIRIDEQQLARGLRAPHNMHNLRCAVVAASLCSSVGAGPSEISHLLKTYTSLPHRLETVMASNGVVWIDDCLSTTPESVIAAAESAGSATPLVLIIGGQSRGISYKPLNDYLCSHADSVQVVAIPSNGANATREFANCHPTRRREADGLEQAVDIAADLAAPTGGTVILSPGAPSFDYYKNYVDKAEHYRKLIEKRWGTS